MTSLPTFPPFLVSESRENIGPRWEKWIRKFEILLEALDVTDPPRKRSLLLHYGGDEIQDLHATLPLPIPQPAAQGVAAPNEYDTLLQSLNNHLLPRRNPNFEVINFHDANQYEAETIDEYQTRLRVLSLTCDFVNPDQEILRHLIQTCLSNALRRKGLRNPTITLDEFLTLAKSYEESEKQASLIEAKMNRSSMNLNAVTNYSKSPKTTSTAPAILPNVTTAPTQQSFPHPNYNIKQRLPSFQHPHTYSSNPTTQDIIRNTNSQRYQRFPTNTRMTLPNQPLLCYNCGGHFPHPMGRAQCPARNAVCTYCGKLGHFQQVCNSLTRQQILIQPSIQNNTAPPHVATLTSMDNVVQSIYDHKDSYTVEDQSTAEPSFIGVLVEKLTKSPHLQLTKTFSINSVQFTALLDSGACVNILDYTTFSTLQPQPEIMPSTITVYPFASTTPLSFLGKFQCQLSHDDINITTTFHVLEQTVVAFNIIGAPTLHHLGLLKGIATLFSSPKPANDASDYKSILKNFPTIFKGIGKLNEFQVHLYIDHSTPPVAIKHHRIPFHLRDKVKTELDHLLANDIIEPALGPTSWLSPPVIIPKPNDQVRICVDMREPNKAIKRIRHPGPTTPDIINAMSGMTLFTKLDLNRGYHQLELDSESRDITTFSTHLGLYRYKRLIFGVNSASEVFQKAIENVIFNIPNTINTSDDILIGGKNYHDHDIKLKAILQRIADSGLTLNESKCEFAKPEIMFFGLIFSNDGIKPDPRKVEAITILPAPQNIQEVRSFLGLTNYCARFIPNYATITEPLRNLTKKDTEWIWTTTHQDSMNQIKQQLTQCTNLQFFDSTKSSTVIVDASPVGLAAMIIQTDKNGNDSVIEFASRALTPTEQRYSQIEREALGIAFGCEKFHLYLAGSNFKVITDHKPLVPIFNNPRSSASSRIQKWILRLQQYTFTVVYHPGKTNPMDYMSRHPIKNSDDYTEHLHIASILSLGAITLSEVQTETSKDRVLSAIREALTNTTVWDTHIPQEPDLHRWNAFKLQRNTISEEEGILLRGNQIILPESLVDRAIAIAHEGHPGIVRTKQTLRDKVWFPHLNDRVKSVIHTCIPCKATTPNNQYQPLSMSTLPKHPWHSVSIDFFGPTPTGEQVLVIADSYSRYPITSTQKSTASTPTIQTLKNIFSMFGVPSTVKSDNGPPFNSRDFAIFAKEMGFEHQKTTPRWPQANGLIERQMPILGKVIRTAIIDKESWTTALSYNLLNYRATTHPSTGQSPATLFFNRPINTRLPAIIPISPFDEMTRERDTQQKAIMKANADKAHHSHHHNLKPGDAVLPKIIDRTKFQPYYDVNPWIITKINGSNVTIQNANGNQINRNCSMLKPIKTYLCRYSLGYKDIYQNMYDNDFLQKPSQLTTNRVTQPFFTNPTQQKNNSTSPKRIANPTQPQRHSTRKTQRPQNYTP